MQQLEELFHEALELEPAARADFMARIRTSIRIWEWRSSHSSMLMNARTISSMHPLMKLPREMIIEAPPALVAGQLVGHYQIIRPLGKGGMGEVYLANDAKLDRQVALKLLPAEFTDHKERLGAALSRKRKPRLRSITRTSSHS